MIAATAAAPRTVLIVDDSRQDIALLEAAFQSLGTSLQLSTVESADAAIEYLEGAGSGTARPGFPVPDLILLDIQMPVRDGFDVLAWIRRQAAEWSQVPIVMLTTSHDYLEIRRAYELGANSFLVKPTGFGELRQLVGELTTYWLVRNRRP